MDEANAQAEGASNASTAFVPKARRQRNIRSKS